MIADFFNRVVIDWLYGQEILDLFDQYFLALNDTQQVLLLIGVAILSVLGALAVVKAILKITLFWIKLVLFIALAYYVVVIVFGIDVLALLGL